MNDKVMYILRGLPGSGKSTLAKHLQKLHNYKLSVCEADDFFIVNEEYKFDKEFIGQAHEQCYQMALLAAKGGYPVAVSNTSTQEWEIEKYQKLGKKYGYNVVCLVVENRHKGVSEHGVPEHAIEKMRDRFELSL